MSLMYYIKSMITPHPSNELKDLGKRKRLIHVFISGKLFISCCYLNLKKEKKEKGS